MATTRSYRKRPFGRVRHWGHEPVAIGGSAQRVADVSLLHTKGMSMRPHDILGSSRFDRPHERRSNGRVRDHARHLGDAIPGIPTGGRAHARTSPEGREPIA